jgi:hypothetical protein
MPTATPRRVLVIANASVAAEPLYDTLAAHADSTEVLVVAPALNTRLRHWFSDEDPARREAARRLDASIDALRDAGVRADGWVGDADPLQAIADALGVFAADEVMIAAQPQERANWLARDLVERACARFSLPIIDLAVDEAEVRVPVLLAA